MPLEYDGKLMAVSAVSLGDITITYTATLAVGAANRQITVSLPSVRSGDLLSVRVAGPIPDGYNVGSAFCSTDGQLIVVVSHPALVLGANFSIPARVFRIT